MNKKLIPRKLASVRSLTDNQKSRSNQFELLETRTVLSGTAIVQPFAQVEYFGDSRDWAVNAVNAPEVWAQGYTGSDILIAVLDSGIDLHHTELVDNIWINDGEVAGNGIDDDGNGYIDDVNGWDFVEDDATPEDVAGHGTFVAGVIAADRNSVGATGIAYDAEILSIRVLDDEGQGTQIDIASGIRYAVDAGADIINISLGGSTGSQRVSRAIEYALENDVFIVSASGNSSRSVPDYPAQYSRSFANVISVGAYDNRDSIASFSNLVGTSSSVQVDAPGVSVYSTQLDGGFRFGSGTSFSAPIVSGIAALALSANPDLTSVELRQQLIDGSPTSVTGSDSFGAVDAAYVVSSVVPPPAAVAAPPILLDGDVNSDGEVGFLDFLAISRNFGQEVDNIGQGDANDDGVVDFQDFLIMSRNYGSVAARTGVDSTSLDSIDEVMATETDPFGDESSLDELI